MTDFSYGAVMPLYAILAREYFGARIMGTMSGAVDIASTLSMAIGPWTSGRLFDLYGSYFRLYIACLLFPFPRYLWVSALNLLLSAWRIS